MGARSRDQYPIEPRDRAVAIFRLNNGDRISTIEMTWKSLASRLEDDMDYYWSRLVRRCRDDNAAAVMGVIPEGTRSRRHGPVPDLKVCHELGICAVWIDRLRDGRRFRVLTFVDLHTRECLAVDAG